MNWHQEAHKVVLTVLLEPKPSMLGMCELLSRYFTQARRLHDVVSAANKKLAKQVTLKAAGRTALKTPKDLVNEST